MSACVLAAWQGAAPSAVQCGSSRAGGEPAAGRRRANYALPGGCCGIRKSPSPGRFWRRRLAGRGWYVLAHSLLMFAVSGHGFASTALLPCVAYLSAPGCRGIALASCLKHRPAPRLRCCRYLKRYAATYGSQGARTAVVLSGQVGGYWDRTAHNAICRIRVHTCFVS